MSDFMPQALAPTRSERVSIRIDHPVAHRRRETTTDASIRGEICEAERFAACREAWAALTERSAHPNAFMDPALILAAAQHGYAMMVVLAWRDREGGRPDLVGAWALRRLPTARPIPWPVLCTTINRLTYIGTPVLDRLFAEQAFSALLDAIATDPAQPNIILANDIYADGTALPAMLSVLEARNASARIVEQRCRARLNVGADPDESVGPHSSKARAEARRKMRRLAEAGGQIVACESAAAVRDAFEDFLVIERSGWKGRRDAGGAAIGLEPQLTTFARTMIGNLSEVGTIGARAIRIEERIVAVALWLRSGRAAVNWKIAYDESYRSLGVGTVVMNDVTRTLVEDTALERIDAGNRNEQGFHARLWPDRQHVVDLVLDARHGGSIAFVIAGEVEALVRALKRRGRVIRDAVKTMRKRRALSFGQGLR